MIAFQEKFEYATENFSNEKSETPLVPVEKPKSLADKYTDPMEELVEGKDVKMPIKHKEPTLEEKDGKVQTRIGNVKVKRVGGNGF